MISLHFIVTLKQTVHSLQDFVRASKQPRLWLCKKGTSRKKSPSNELADSCDSSARTSWLLPWLTAPSTCQERRRIKPGWYHTAFSLSAFRRCFCSISLECCSRSYTKNTNKNQNATFPRIHTNKHRGELTKQQQRSLSDGWVTLELQR